jgi:ATP-dependent DNA helicase DinG
MESVLPQFIQQTQGRILVGQTPRTDINFLQYAGKLHAVMIPRFRIIDISRLFLRLYPDARKYNLDQIAIKVGLRRREGHHNALEDAFLTAKIFMRLLDKLSEKELNDVRELLRIGRML